MDNRLPLERSCCDTYTNQEHKQASGCCCSVNDSEPDPHCGVHNGQVSDFGYPTLGSVARGLTPTGEDLTQDGPRFNWTYQVPEPSIKITKGSITITVEDGKANVEFADGEGYTEDLSPQAERVTTIIIEALLKFWEKNRGYGDTGYVLGARGQYADINRKVGKLKHTLWDGNPAIGESMTEMLQDIIGHSGLTIDYINQENK